MYRDYLGNEVTAESESTVTGINDFIEGFLAYENKAANILKASEAEPDNCLANAYTALFYMFLESKEAPDLARPFVEKAEAAAAKASRREQMTTAAVRAWIDGDVAGNIKLANEIAEAYPHDLAMVKQAQYHNFNLGNCAGMLVLAEKVADQNQDVPHMHGLSAFAFEQCHLLEEAEAAARKAIEMKRKEPWAHHALAHVMLTQGRTQESIDFLTDVSETWTDLNSFMLTHNWWHLSLNHLAQGHYDKVLDFYDRHVWGAWKEYSQDQIGAVSLLMRLELVGVDVGDRWQDVGTYLKVRADDFVQPFLTMQYLYGLARADLPEADSLMENLRGFAPKAPAVARQAWSEVAVPACEGLLAHARKDYETAYGKMAAALPRLLEIGGSHAQRDLFDQVLLDSMLETGRYEKAQQMLEIRRGFDPLAVPTNTALAGVYRHLGLEREAQRAEARLAAA